MPELYYIGLDVHKKSVGFSTKSKDGTIVARGSIKATRAALTECRRVQRRSNSGGERAVGHKATTSCGGS
jgi:hypothetical protein